MSVHQKLLVELAKDRKLAHEVLFKHRHPLETPHFHAEVIEAFHDPRKENVVVEAFRGGGKSTIGEEALTIKALFMNFSNALIVSSTEKRAAERLEAIKHEIENNDHLIELFGEQTGDIWQANKIVLRNGVCLQAVGVGQSVRGVKHHEFRPDFVWFDDIEDDDSTKSPEDSQARLRWMYRTLMPVCAKSSSKRMTGNRLSPFAVVSKVADDPAWNSYRFPVCYLSLTTGEEIATWFGLHDMDWVKSKRAEYERLGLAREWASEYMCEAMSETTKTFKTDHLVIYPRVRTWQATYAMFDPAKTTQARRHQAFTGKAVWSWLGPKLVVWDCLMRPWLPSDLINDIFETEKEYQPVLIGVEADGLEEWLSEPLRLAQTQRRISLPNLKSDIRAPRDKDGFIKGLEPHFISRNIELAKPLPELEAQLINFPDGRKDGLNALAYALKLRPGMPVYEAFSQENIIEDADPTLRAKKWLCLNCDGAHTTGALVQYDGTFTVLGDWIEGPDPAVSAEIICKQAQLIARGKIDIVVPQKEYDPYSNKGVVAALRRIPRGSSPGGSCAKGRGEIRAIMQKRGIRPSFLVSSDAGWTLRALAGGYHIMVGVRGHVDGEPEPGAYRTLMEGIESFAAIMGQDEADEDHNIGYFRTSRDGNRYRSLIGDR